MSSTPDAEVLSAPNIIEYPFTRTTGPVIGAFMTGLREGVMIAIKGSDGRVLMPPPEYDPVTAATLTELVEVGDEGEVLTWAWMRQPLETQPLDRPFAWALVKLDGADTGMLHAVDAGSPEAMSTGMRVKVRWRAEREGSITDIECFEPLGTGALGRRCLVTDIVLPERLAGVEPVRSIRTPARIEYTFTAGIATSKFLRGLAEKKILGQRCPKCGKVYVPARGACPTDGVPTAEIVELPHVGTVTTFCVVNVQFYGQAMELPYVSALILLDDSDIPIMHLIQEVAAADVHMGQRVEAVWVPDDELAPTLESIRYFRPTGEPDADYETYKDNV